MKRNFGLSTLLLLVALPIGAIAAESDRPLAGSPQTGSPQTGSPAAGAATPPVEPTPLFDQLDVNRDGYVTKQEAKRSAEVTTRFKALDGDRDSKISLAEFKKGMQPKL